MVNLETVVFEVVGDLKKSAKHGFVAEMPCAGLSNFGFEYVGVGLEASGGIVEGVRAQYGG